MPGKKVARAAFVTGQQKSVLSIPMVPIPLAASEILALVAFGNLGGSLFFIPMISDNIADCREASVFHLIQYNLRWIVRRYEGGELIGLPEGIIQRVDLFLKSLTEKFSWEGGVWVINAFKEILAKWEKMAKKTYPTK